MATLRSETIPNHVRARMMSCFRIPQNLFVVLTIYRGQGNGDLIIASAALLCGCAILLVQVCLGRGRPGKTDKIE